MRIKGQIKIVLDELSTKKIFRRVCKLFQLDMGDGPPNDIWPHLLRGHVSISGKGGSEPFSNQTG